jgi:hypothetical protein
MIAAPSQKFDVADHFLDGQQVVDQHQTLNDLSYCGMGARTGFPRAPFRSSAKRKKSSSCVKMPPLGERKRQMFLIGRTEFTTSGTLVASTPRWRRPRTTARDTCSSES